MNTYLKQHQKNLTRTCVIFSFFTLLQACGLGSSTDECENTHPAQEIMCDTIAERENSTWDKARWDEGKWKD